MPESEAQTYNEGVEMLCNGWMEIEDQIRDAANPDRTALIMDWIDGHLENPQARELMSSLRSMAPRDAGATLIREAQSAGVSECLLLE